MLTVVEKKQAEISELCRRYGVARLDLFGSAATGNFNPATSDLDFLVTFLASDSMTRADQYFGLLEALRNLFKSRIDLLTHQSLRNPFLIKAANESKRALYAA